MSGFDKEMQDALRADAEKLRAMGADVADPVFLEPTNCEPKANGWRDIESDPPEPTREELLCYEPSAHDDNGKELWAEFCYVTTGYALKNQYACGTEDQNPTHWRPLPLPPGEEEVLTETGPQERGHGATTGSHHNTSTSVRELEWVQSSTQTWHADTGKGAYRILEVETDWFTASAPRQAALLGSLSTLEDAKAACQSDFQKRVNECLEPTNCEPKASGWREEAYSAAFDVLWRAITEYRWQDLPEGAVTEHLRESSKRALDAAATYLPHDDTIYHDAHRASVRSTIATSMKREEALRAENAEMKARNDKLEVVVRQMVDAIGKGAVDSEEIVPVPGDGPPYRFHEEWAHHARSALSPKEGE